MDPYTQINFKELKKEIYRTRTKSINPHNNVCSWINSMLDYDKDIAIDYF